MSIPRQFDQVSVVCKANVYFDGKVVSHTVWLADGSKKTLGLIHPGIYHFTTGEPEKMEIVAGACRVRRARESDWKNFGAGSAFDVPGKSAFDIAVDDGVAEYICSFG